MRCKRHDNDSKPQQKRDLPQHKIDRNPTRRAKSVCKIILNIWCESISYGICNNDNGHNIYCACDKWPTASIWWLINTRRVHSLFVIVCAIIIITNIMALYTYIHLDVRRSLKAFTNIDDIVHKFDLFRFTIAAPSASLSLQKKVLLFARHGIIKKEKLALPFPAPSISIYSSPSI